MKRAETKEDLLTSANNQFLIFNTLLEKIDKNDVDKEFTFSIEGKKEAHYKRDKNMRDVIIHLYEWQQLLINFVNSNINNIKKPFIPEPYNFRTYGNMNIEFTKKHQSTSYFDALTLLRKSHKDVIEIINGFSNEELFEKGVFKWTGGSTLGSYMVSSTASHYVFAIKKLKMHLKTLK